jgi:hypothetical protein
MPHEIRVATVWYRPTVGTQRPPDYFVHETADWLVLPYELSGLSIDELRENKPELESVIDRLEELIEARRGRQDTG